MIDPRTIMNLIKPRISQVLTIAEAALPSSQFMAFGKLVLDEFGWNGLETEIHDLVKHHDKRNG